MPNAIHATGIWRSVTVVADFGDGEIRYDYRGITEYTVHEDILYLCAAEASAIFRRWDRLEIAPSPHPDAADDPIVVRNVRAVTSDHQRIEMARGSDHRWHINFGDAELYVPADWQPSQP